MKIYIYADSDDLKAIAEPLLKEIGGWVKKSGEASQLINDQHEPDVGADQSGKAFWNLGMHLFAKRKSDLRKVLDFLYGVSKTYRCNFVIGIVSSEKRSAQDICYFGHEEGKPDVHEIANYMNFKL